MERFACLEVRIACGSCGQSIPINGPYRRVTCSACFNETPVPPDILAGFLNDFEEEYEGLQQGQGQGGTLMSGSGTYKYGYWRIPLRCSSCKKLLRVPSGTQTEVIRCENCGATYHAFPAPEWLKKEVPSAVVCVTPGPPPGEAGQEPLRMDEGSSQLIVMSCPKCGGALEVSSKSERIMSCQYCSCEVYVPDEVWARLHPVRVAEEWFVGLEGRNIHELRAERRRRDEQEEKEFLQGWKLRNAPRKVKKSIGRFVPVFIIVLAVAGALSLIGALSGGAKGVGSAWSELGPLLIVPVVVLVPIWFAVRSTISGKIGKRKQCKKALAELAAKHNWKHESAEYASVTGYIDTKYRGRDVEVNPDEDYAIEVEVSDSVLYIKTEPPGYPGDDLQRFSSGDECFDELFPIRYARPDFAERIESSRQEADRILSPIYWFLARWGSRLGRMKIDWSTAGVHIAPGHMDIMDTGGRFILPEDLEPLLEDMMTLAAALDAVAMDREPELPESLPSPKAPAGD
ncbi:hypothetical protein JW921_11310 [Candidatus Fermentibacterales bacterium]|nr:hypothetical protein [Candidatus Fermentibacterales bacterium]